jgi:putative spermidine/putrescine transport system ATP-binding protein
MQIEIKGLLKNYGVTSIIVTHDQEEALSMADPIVVLNRGRVEQIGAPDALYDRPASLFVNQFIGHANFLAGRLMAPDRVRLDAGADIALALPATVPVGAPVMVSVRPENITITQSTDPGVLAATVRVTLPLGAAEVIEVVAGDGTTIKIHRPRSPASKPIAAGTALGLAITDPTGIGIFADPAA